MLAPDRRKFLTHALTGLGVCAVGLPSARVRAADDVGMGDATALSAADLITPQAQRAINLGLKYLANRQQEDGAFGRGGYSRNVAICALSGMAFLSSGSTPGRGPYGQQATRCVKYILDHTKESGFITAAGSTSHGPMYGHGFATLFLAESYGMSPDSTIREKLNKAVKLIIATQNDDGGWRYAPRKGEADVSATICQIMALRAARNAGVFVPNETIQRCIDYVKRSQNTDGGFMYMLDGGPSAFPRSAAGVVALYSAGVYDGPEIDKGLGYLMEHLPRNRRFDREAHYYYGHYYAAQAMWQAGGKHWSKWYPAIREALITRQQDSGRWLDSISSEYGTAMACIILQMPNNYLPIFQR